MSRIFKLPVITEDPCVLFWDIDQENSPRILAYKKQKSAVYETWQELLKQPFDAMEVFVPDVSVPDKRTHIHILTCSLRALDAVQLTIVSDRDGLPLSHKRYDSQNDLIRDLVLLSVHNAEVFAEILEY